MSDDVQLQQWLSSMKLSWIQEHYQELLEQAIKKKTPHSEYLTELFRGEYETRQERGLIRRIKAAKFPVEKNFGNFNWQWPELIDRPLIEHLTHLQFLKNKSNIV